MIEGEVVRRVHPEGEVSVARIPAGLPAGPVVVDTHGRRFHVEWDPQAPVTPLGQLVFFSQFLATAGLFTEWVRSCPLRFSSPNAPSLTDLLGTSVLSVLSGQFRYAHVTALRADTVNPQGLGMSKVCSEDSVRRGFQDADPAACAAWQTEALRRSWMPALRHPWILDIDVTVKSLYGHQEGAEVGYNPHKPGRPSHAYHTLVMRSLRLVLDVEVRPGKQHAAGHGRANLWGFWDRLPAECRPWLLCGDASYGHQELMAEAEARLQSYLFRLRQTRGVRKLVRWLETQSGWKPALNGWEGIEGELQLSGWTRRRRVIVFRRRKERSAPASTRPELGSGELALGVVKEAPQWEYQVVVTNLKLDLVGICDLYRQRADVENTYDELKNQWGWGGFMTRDLLRCQVAARTVALVYNWWSLFVACAQPERGREAITSRPLLLCAVGRVVESGRQLTIRLTSTHGDAAQAQRLLSGLSLFLSGLKNTAEQLTPQACWERIWERILAPWLRPQAFLGVPSG
jgi:Transposase DDE domain group 1